MALRKELLETHKSAETLFIGCGGVGSKIVSRVADKCVGNESENVRFVVFDTNVNDLGKINSSSAKVTTIQTSSTQTVFEYLADDKDAYDNWFPNNQILFGKTVSEGAGQVRAISRLALNSIIKTGKINELYRIIDDLFRKTGEGMKQALRVCVVSSAAGGTGSGIVMALSMFIRKYIKQNYPNRAVIIRGLLVLPSVLDAVIDSKTEREALRRNAYATIKEINAFMMKGSGFFKVDKDLERFENLSIQFPGAATDSLKSYDSLPFDFCFLFDSLDQQNATATSLDQYYDSAAQSLYEQHIGPMNKDAFSIEDNIIKEICGKGNFGRNRFGGIGASVLKYPYEDVVRYIAYRRAIDRIGGEGEAAKWSKYDKAYKRKLKEFKMGKASDQVLPPEIGDVYVSELNSAKDKFSTQIKKIYLSSNEDAVESDVMETVETFIGSYLFEIRSAVDSSASISQISGEVSGINSAVNYLDGEKIAKQNLNRLRTFENVVRKEAPGVARNKAEAILYNDMPLNGNFASSFIESVVKTNDGAVHPNAARYVLYLAERELQKLEESAKSEVERLEKKLVTYSPTTENKSFDAKYTDEEEFTIDAACDALDGTNPGFFKKHSKQEHATKIANALASYKKTISTYYLKVAEKEAAKAAYEYISLLNREFERFYAGFELKVRELERKIDVIVDSLKYKKGDCIKYICADKGHLDELYNRAPDSESGMLLPGELNAKIFNAVKKNVAWYKENEYETLVDDERVDIFDEILLEYFCDDVQDSCDDMININILQAIMLEKKLNVYLEKVKIMDKDSNNSNDKKSYITVPDYELDKYIHSVISTGTRLAAPNIQGVNNCEPREVTLSSYNNSILNMREKRITDFLPKGTASDSVSKYELRFFNAIYNLTPDKISKFSKEKSDGDSMDAGMYFSAYHEYVKDIGPDSTKSMTLSLHIDKRWDSVAAMPEIDLEFQKDEMVKIHQALIYGFVYENIKHRYVSSKYPDKKVFVLENLDDEIQSLIVSNGTPCDLFYEILDALYIDRSSVKIIEEVIKYRRKKDAAKNPDYEACEFAKALKELKIADYHPGEVASLFEIPVLYYNSLSNSKRYEGEIATLIESVIKTFKDEVSLRESVEDANCTYCEVLKQQFKLFIKNYKECAALNCDVKISANTVIELIYKKIKKIYETLEPIGYEESIAEMKKIFNEN